MCSCPHCLESSFNDRFRMLNPKGIERLERERQTAIDALRNIRRVMKEKAEESDLSEAEVKVVGYAAMALRKAGGR